MTAKKNLNKENFWNDLHKQYPKAVDDFCKWIDQYKKDIGWDKLLNKNYHKTNIRRASNGEITGIDFSAPKFHDLPFDMQRGILLKYFEEKSQKAEWYKNIAIDGIREFFEEFNKL